MKTPHEVEREELERAGSEPGEHPPLDAGGEGAPAAGAARRAMAGAESSPVAAMTFPSSRLRVVPWADPVLDQLGHDPRSHYVERFWVSILGPSSTLLLRRLATGLELAPEGFDIEVEAWAHELGVGIRGGRNSPFWRAVERTGRFRATRLQGETLFVRRRLDSLNLRQLERLPPHLQGAHRAWVARQLAEHRKADLG